MANYKFTADLVNDVLFRAGEPTDGTSDFEEEALRVLNRAYRAVWMGGGEFVERMNEPWLWLKKDPPGVITIQPSIITGTVSVANNSTAITFSAAPAASVAGYFFRTDDESAVFRISSHTGGSAAATLDSVYTGDTNTTATYRLMKLEYTLATDALRIISPMRVQGLESVEIDGVDLTALDRDFPIRDIESGLPTKFAMVTETKLRFNRYGGEEATELLRAEYDYLQKPSDLTDSPSEEPLVPLEHRHVLADIAIFYLYTSKGDSRAEPLGLQAQAVLRAMSADNRARMTQFSRTTGQLYQRGRHTQLKNRVKVVG